MLSSSNEGLFSVQLQEGATAGRGAGANSVLVASEWKLMFKQSVCDYGWLGFINRWQFSIFLRYYKRGTKDYKKRLRKSCFSRLYVGPKGYIKHVSCVYFYRMSNCGYFSNTALQIRCSLLHMVDGWWWLLCRYGTTYIFN